MGLYINPKDVSKEVWLKRYGIPVDSRASWESIKSDFPNSLPVVLLYNPGFTAAGVAYSEREFKEFMAPDGRQKTVFAVEKADIERVTNGELTSYIN